MCDGGVFDGDVVAVEELYANGCVAEELGGGSDVGAVSEDDLPCIGDCLVLDVFMVDEWFVVYHAVLYGIVGGVVEVQTVEVEVEGVEGVVV